MYRMATKDAYSYRCTVDTTEISQVQIGSKFKNVCVVRAFPDVKTNHHTVLFSG